MAALRNTILAGLRRANRIPEFAVKNRFRAGCLTRVRHALPRELMIRAGDCVVQVGMNNEDNIQRLSNCVGVHGRAIIVEGDQNNVRKIRTLIAQRQLTNVDVITCGAWSEKTQLRFKIAKHPDDNRIEREGVSMPQEIGRNAYSDTLVIDVDTLDHLLADRDIAKVDYLEVTVNGAELEVLRGAESILRQTRRIFTAGRARLPDGGPANRYICRFLQERGFQTAITLASPSARATFGRDHGDVFAWRH
jgi:FkbM family methyltransferase